MIPSFKHGIIASSRPKVVAGGGGSDVTPNAVSWDNTFYDGIEPLIYVAVKQITGINQTITLSVSYSQTTVYLYYLVSDTDGPTPVYSVGDFTGFTQILSGGQFTVTNNKYVHFAVGPSPTYTGFVGLNSATVTNVTDSNTVLSTFGYSAIG